MEIKVSELVPFTKKISGIYKIQNKINGKIYIGQSVDVYRRLKKHIWNIEKENNSALCRAFKKYGIENFTYEVIEECEVDTLDEREIYYIKLYNSYVGFKDSNGYNLNLGGGSNRGWIPSEENKKRFKEVNLRGQSHFARKTICDGIIFDCAKDCAEYFNIPYTSIKDWLSRKNKMPYEWYKMGLRYYDTEMSDYEYQKPKKVKIIFNNKEYDSIRKFCDSEKIDRNIIKKIREGKIETPDYLIEGGFQMIEPEEYIKEFESNEKTKDIFSHERYNIKQEECNEYETC